MKRKTRQFYRSYLLVVRGRRWHMFTDDGVEVESGIGDLRAARRAVRERWGDYDEQDKDT